VFYDPTNVARVPLYEADTVHHQIRKVFDVVFILKSGREVKVALAGKAKGPGVERYVYQGEEDAITSIQVTTHDLRRPETFVDTYDSVNPQNNEHIVQDGQQGVTVVTKPHYDSENRKWGTRSVSSSKEGQETWQ